MRGDIAGEVVRACVLLFMSFGAAVPALAKNWAGGTSNWNVPGNWSPAGVPIAGEAVNIVFTDDTARTVTYDAGAGLAIDRSDRRRNDGQHAFAHKWQQQQF